MLHLKTALGIPRVPTNPDELRRVPLLFEPGTQWNYGINTDVAGRACEVVSGKRLDVLVAEEVTGPLGMADTKFITTPEMEARRITLYRRESAATMTPEPVVVPSAMPFMSGGGGLHSTAADYMKFVQAILSGSILGPDIFAEMTRPQTGDVNMVQMISSVPAQSSDFHAYPEMEVKWGLGFMMNMEPTAEGRSAGSLAWAGLCNTYYWIDLKRGVCGVFFAQLLPFADPATLRAFAAYEAAVYRSLG
jgi:CubicO group peptidase (beta-lactamase class C family)